MVKMIFTVLTGTENPTRACIPILQALANKERGDEVHIALGGEGVVLIRNAVIESVVPLGWPPLKELFEKVLDYQIPIYV